MIIISERKSGNEIYYTKEIQSEKGKVAEDIRYRALTVEKDNVDYYLLYDSSMRICSDAFQFVNFYMSDNAENTRIKAQQALKLLFSFEQVINKEAADFTPSDINNFKYFLHGYSPKGQLIHYQLITTRSNQTVNSYLSICRQYLSYLGIEKSYLQQKYQKPVSISLNDDHYTMDVFRYKTNERTSSKISLEVPMYISVEEFKTIIKLIRTEYTLRDEIIVRLMYQCGLRIGEVLGLTSEDIVIEKVDDQYVPIIYIRNRTTDSRDQMAKTCMKVYNKKQYKSKDYRTKGYGYQYVTVPQDLFDLIDEYIEETHVFARENKRSTSRYFENTMADTVLPDGDNDNFYVFLNEIHTPLHSYSWNKVLREIFKKVGIPLDKEKRQHNLNHRFRHGFAMFNVQYLNCKEVELAERMRHNSIASVYKYYRPTVSDQIKIKTAFANSLYEMIPELKR